jgi:hypothetical protein
MGWIDIETGANYKEGAALAFVNILTTIGKTNISLV